jgi:SAM-dependent methyltransferase
MSEIPIEQHNLEIQKNLNFWASKPILKTIYKEFYRLISSQVDFTLKGEIVELGSGIGNIKMEIPQAICTDLFENPWIDSVENAYSLSYAESSVSNLILFDVFHHIQYPGTALQEFYRVLNPGGRVIIFDPSTSLMGYLIYGLFHHEPVAQFRKIQWHAPEGFNPWSSSYYAAQGNADRVFFSHHFQSELSDWKFICRAKYAALTYILSGGYSKPQLFPERIYNHIKRVEKFMDYCPKLFSTRSLIVLQKK